MIPWPTSGRRKDRDRRGRLLRGVSCSQVHQPPPSTRTPTPPSHDSPAPTAACNGTLKRRRQVAVSRSRAENRSIVSRKTCSSDLLLSERKVASAVKALRFGRSSDPEEPATREARRGSLTRSLFLTQTLSFSLSVCYSFSSHSRSRRLLFCLLLFPQLAPFCSPRGATRSTAPRRSLSRPLTRALF